MTRIFYSIFGPYIAQFIELKNSLGYKYQDAGYALTSFDTLALKKNITEVAIKQELADVYCIKRPNESEKTRYNRIQIVAQFSRFLCDLGFKSYIPKLPKIKSTFTPYIFPKAEINAIFDVCDKLKPSPRNRKSSVFAIPLLIRLLYSTGIRLGEALGLLCQDVDLNEKHIILHNCKNGKDRMVPISDSLAKVFERYLIYRNLNTFNKKTERLFTKFDGSPLSKYNAYRWFRKIIFFANISHGGRGHGPRLHDLRHTFSVHSLVTMSKSGLDLYYSLPILSTYLGHQSLDATESYVRLTAEMYPELIRKTSDLCSGIFPVLNINIEDNETY